MTDRMGYEEGDVTLESAVGRIRELIAQIEGHDDPEVVSRVFELLDWIDTLHREGLERIAGGLAGAGLLDKALDDPVVAHLFAVYDLVDSQGSEAEVVEALEEIRPYVRSHGGEMVFDSIEAGVVRVRLLGACDGCPSSIVTLTQSLERAIRERWPGLVRIEVVGEPEDVSWSPVTVRTSR